MPGALSLKRLLSLVTITLVNALVIFTTIFFDWTLTEATLAYLSEFVILVLLIYARVLVAKRLPGATNSSHRWQLAKAKVLAIGVTLPMYALFAGVVSVLLFVRSMRNHEDFHLPESTLRGLIVCAASFLVAHLVSFIEQYRRGLFDELIEDGRVMAQFLRYPPLLLAGGATATMSTDGGEVEPWIFFGAMALMAIVATGTYMAEQDAVNSTLHRS